MNPMYLGSLKARLIQFLEESNRIYRFLHIPVQSGERTDIAVDEERPYCQDVQRYREIF